MHVHLYPLMIAIICFHQMLGANAQHMNFSLSPTHRSSGVSVLRVALLLTMSVLEGILPTIAAFMPDKAPLVVAFWDGCNALSLRIPYAMKNS